MKSAGIDLIVTSRRRPELSARDNWVTVAGIFYGISTYSPQPISNQDDIRGHFGSFCCEFICFGPYLKQVSPYFQRTFLAFYLSCEVWNLSIVHNNRLYLHFDRRSFLSKQFFLRLKQFSRLSKESLQCFREFSRCSRQSFRHCREFFLRFRPSSRHLKQFPLH